MFLTREVIREFAARSTTQSAVREYFDRAQFSAQARVFLSHSHRDAHDLSKDDVKALQAMLIKLSYDVYIDWLDPDMPLEVCEDTARRIKEKIDMCDRFLLAATTNAVNSRWVPWELGYADKARGVNNVAILPIADPNGRWEGAEYLRLYPRVLVSKAKRLAIFQPSTSHGARIEDWMALGVSQV